MATNLSSFTDILSDFDEIADSQPLSLSAHRDFEQPYSELEENNQRNRTETPLVLEDVNNRKRPSKYIGQRGEYRSVEEIDEKYQSVFTYPLFNLVQSKVIDDALYSDKSMVVCAPTGSGKTVIFEMAIIQLLQELEEKNYKDDFKIIYMAPVKSLCTERLTDWYSKFTPLGLLCVEVTGDTDVDFPQLKPYRIIITTPEKWDILTRRWRDHRSLVEVIKLFLIDEVHILNDNMRGPVLEAVVSRMKTIESSAQSVHRIEQLQQHYQENSNETVNQNCQENPTVSFNSEGPPRIRFVAVSATVNNPEDVAAWLGTDDRPAVYHKFGDECRPVKLNRVVEGYPCPEGMSIFKFDIVLNYKLWPIIQKYHNGKPTLIFCNTRKSVELTAETLSKELTITFTPEQKTKLTTVASTIKNRKIQQLILSGVGCHHAGLLYEERLNIEQAFRNRDLPILITTTTLAMGVNLPAHLVIIKNTQQYVKGAYQEYSISTVLQMVGRAGRPQFDTEATAVIMTRLADKPRYQSLVGGSEPLQSYLHKRLAENLNSEVALGTVSDVAQCVQWLRSTFLYVRAAKDPKWYLGLPLNAPHHHILKKIEELCVKAMNGLASSGLITMDEASCIESTEAGRLMSLYYLDLETMKHIMKIKGTEKLDQLLWIICESHELADMHLRVDERRCLNALNRNNQAATIRFPMKGKINTRQMKLNCMIQAVLGCLPISEPALNQEASKVMRIADRVCKCLVAYVTRPDLVNKQPDIYTAVLNSIVLAKCIAAHLWENSPYVSKQLRGIGPTFSTLLATAGKVNFLLLEESHPRDLERIMNKSAPAGNVIRKQISLLPKYQITATPVDEKRVTIQISLINQAYLAENLEDLTAGPNHKSFILIGDSENHLLMLTSFKDKDLLSVYDGTITHEITRKHSFEHKILAHCVSSTFVGIDVQCEYVFKSLEITHCRGVSTAPIAIPPATLANKPTKRQTCITDVFKERKRKTNEDITQSKEKKKRENALMIKLKDLKKSLESASSETKEDIMNYEVYEEMSQSEIIEGGSSNYQTISHLGNIKTPLGESKILSEYEYPDVIDNDSPEDVMADEKIESILNEIESEISKKGATDIEKHVLVNKERDTQSSYFVNSKKESFLYQPQSTKFSRKSFKVPYSKLKQCGKNSHTKSNFNFIEHLEKNASPNDDVESNSTNQNTFSNAIKSQVEKFLQQTRETNIKKPNYMTIIDERPFDKSYKEENQLSSMDIEIEKQSIYSVPINTQVIKNKNILDGKINDEIDECTFTDANQEENNKNSYAGYGENFDLLPERDYHKSNFYPESNLTYSKNIVMDLTKLDDPSYNMKGSKHISPGHKMTKNLNKVEDNDLEELPTIDLNVNSIMKGNDTAVIDLTENTKYNHMEQNLIISEPFEPTIVSDQNDYAQPVCHEIIHKPQIYNDCLELNKNGVVADCSTLELPKLLNTESEKQLVSDNNNAETIESNTELTSPKYSFDNSVVNCSYQELNEIASVKYILNEQKQPRKTEIEVINKPHIKSLQQTALTEANGIVQKQTIGSKLDTATEAKFPQLSIDPLITFDSNYSIINHKTTNSPIGLLNSSHMNDNENNTVKPIQKKLEVESYINAPVFNGEYNSHESYNGPYINKYSFTATKIDVSSKNEPHNIKIIRRVKLDVDVTEIISKNEKHSSEDKTVSSEVKSTDKKICPEEMYKILKFSSKNNINDKMQNDVIKDTNLDGITKLDEPAFGGREYNTGTIKSNLTLPFSAQQNEEGSKKYHTKEDQFKEISKQEIELKNVCEHKIVNSFRRINEVEPVEQKEGTVQYCTETENFAKIRNQNIDESQFQTINSNRRNNDVENILKKYSKIFQKNSMNATEKRKILAEAASTKETKSSYETVMKQNQSNRAYSINKLNNSNISLPKAIVEVSKKSTPTPMLTNSVILSRIKALEPTKYEVNGNVFHYKQNLKDHNTYLEEEKEIEYLSPPAIKSVTQEAPLNEIDQSMFNPKTVLQCFSRESPEYIPPPLEFCDDNISYSPTQTEFGDNENECEVNQLPSHETKENLYSIHHASTPTNSSIFNNDCDGNVLTPSREIETWTLCREEEFTPSFEYNRNPLKSFTVMRKNSPASNLDSRNTKLHNFKFTPKNKLRF